MSASAGPGLSALPTRFPVFPLAGAILLPGGNLPLNVFEPRYLQMTRDAMRTDRIIGMIQPNGGSATEPNLYPVGCAGRITSFAETDDGRYLITLTGVCRYDVVEELAAGTPYRQVIATFERWRGDLEQPPCSSRLRQPLLNALRSYFDVYEITADWAQIESAPLGGLVTSLAMICPFEPSEKQALLEATDPDHRTRVLITLMQMGACSSKASACGTPH